jgi:hypothetical protein
MIQSLTEIVERLFRDLNMKSFNCHFVSFLSSWTLFSLCPKVRLTNFILDYFFNEIVAPTSERMASLFQKHKPFRLCK